MSTEMEIVDLRERGKAKDGTPLFSDRRLYVQFLAFSDCRDPEPLAQALEAFRQPGALYLDLNDPWGVGLVLFHENPEFFTGEVRRFLNESPFADLTFQPELAMFGRTYSIGYEWDMDEVLLQRPASRILDPGYPWAVWYPVRRTKAFEALPEPEKHDVLMDHGNIGKLFGKAGIAQDIRLACHGMDRNDNDFIIGVVAKELAGASAVVQAMRKSLQTMHHLDNLGPFFTGRVFRQFPAFKEKR